MEMSKENYQNRLKRHVVATAHSCSMGVLTFENREWTSHVAHPVNVSMTGLGVESEHPIEPGIIWFKEGVWGHRCGVLVWCKNEGGRYRAGIQFVPLDQREEEYLRQHVEQAQSSGPLEDPERFVEALMDHFRKSQDSVN
jgi:hypothetical protein